MSDVPEAGGSTEPAQPGPRDPEESADAAQVRRLLAEARYDAPMPPEVAARMDAVIAGLANGADAGQGEVPGVVPITRARRRNVAGLLLAAAAVVLGAVLLGPHLHGSGTGSPASGAEQASGGQALGATGSSGASAGAQPSASTPTLAQSNRAPLHRGRLVVRPLHFSADALSGRRLLRTNDSSMNAASTARACPGRPRSGTAVPAEYRHAPALLVYGPVRGGSQVVDLYVCGDGRPVRSTMLSVP